MNVVTPRSRWVCALLLHLLFGAVTLFSETPSDALLGRLEPNGFVNDFAGVLTPSQREALEKRVRETQEKNGAEITVVTVQSMEGGHVDDFTRKLFQKWGIGRKGKNNGVMLLVAIQDRKARIEVGYGLEAILPDALAGRILNEDLFPAFKRQAYADGLTRAVERLAQIIEGGGVDPTPAGGKPPDLEEYWGAAVVLLMLIPAGIFQGGFLADGKCSGCSWLGFLAFTGLLLSGMWMADPGLAVACGVATLLAAILGFYLVRCKNWQFDVPSSRSYRSSDWGGGGFSGGSGGGFSGGFGGGSSGGGGASGGW